jgi:hypothetical protein
MNTVDDTAIVRMKFLRFSLTRGEYMDMEKASLKKEDSASRRDETPKE